MPLTIRHIPTGAEYEVADLAAFTRAYGNDPDWTIDLPTPVQTPVQAPAAGAATSDEDFADSLDPWKADEVVAAPPKRRRTRS